MPIRESSNIFFAINFWKQINRDAWLKFTGELFLFEYITTNWQSSISPSKCIMPKSRSAWRASALRFAHVNATELEFLQEEKLSRSRETYARAEVRRFPIPFSLSHLHFLLYVAVENSAVSLYRKEERERMIVMVGGVRGWGGWNRWRRWGRGKEKCRLKICGSPSAEGASARKLGPGENNTSRGGWRNGRGGESFSTLRARNMLITFGHRRRRPSGIGLRGYYNAGIRINNAP